MPRLSRSRRSRPLSLAPQDWEEPIVGNPRASRQMGDHPLWSIGDAVTEDAEGRLRAIDAGEGPQSMQNASGVAFLTALSAVIKVTAVIN